MARGRKAKLRVGDKVTLINSKKQGIIVHIATNPDSVNVINGSIYNVHWYPNGKGIYAKDQLKKVKATMSVETEEKQS